MKLVENSGSGEAELPAADSCGLEEDEEEGGDSVTIRSSKGARFFKKITNKIKKVLLICSTRRILGVKFYRFFDIV